MFKTRRLILIGLLTALGLILHIVEGMIPMSAVVPGARLGLANVVSLMGLVLLGFSAGFQVLLLRILIGSLLAGTFMTINFYLSFSGGLLAYLMMALLYFGIKDKFSIFGVSIFGAVFHNVGQILTAYVIIGTAGLFYYLPYLTLLAVPTGLGVGFITYFTADHLKGYNLS
ncbi:MAG: Gx transporter family protein [Halanaerobiaceae bacterium]